MTRFRYSTTCLLIAAAFGAGWFMRAGMGESGLNGKEESPNHPPHSSASSGGIAMTDPKNRPSRMEAPKRLGLESFDRTASPQDLLAHSLTLEPGATRDEYMRNLVAEWIRDDSSLSKDQQDWMLRVIQADALGFSRNRTGTAVLLSGLIADLSNPEVRHAWKEAHASDPARSEIFSKLALADIGTGHPGHLMDAAASWLPWEKARYQNHLLESWAEKNPTGARDWLESNPGEFSTAAASAVYEELAAADPPSFESSLNSIADPRLRDVALRALALSKSSDTKAAIAWADSLATAQDRDLAHEVIYDRTPRGLGVMLQVIDGFPIVAELTRDGIGLQASDRIVSVSELGGEPRDLYGRDFGEIADGLRGEPGSPVSITVLRPTADGSGFEQVTLNITREQLYLGG